MFFFNNILPALPLLSAGRIILQTWSFFVDFKLFTWVVHLGIGQMIRWHITGKGTLRTKAHHGQRHITGKSPKVVLIGFLWQCPNFRSAAFMPLHEPSHFAG
jgi:hypothetical protein